MDSCPWCIILNRVPAYYVDLHLALAQRNLLAADTELGHIDLRLVLVQRNSLAVDTELGPALVVLLHMEI